MWRIARPVGLTLAAALAFTALLHRHHSRFLDGLVNRVQSYQLTTAQDLSAFLQKSMEDMQHSLERLAASPELGADPQGVQQALDTYYGGNSDVLDAVAVVSHDGVELAQAPRAGAGDMHQPAIATGAAPAGTRSQSGSVVVSIPMAGDPQRQLRATVNVYRLCGRSFGRGEAGRNAIRSLITADGQAIFDGSGVILDSRVASHQRRPGDRPQALDVPTLSYLLDNCIQGGQNGLLEAVSSESQSYLMAYCPVIMGQRYALVVSSPKSDVAVPLSSHARLTYTLMLLLTVFYFAVGYMAYRGEMAQISQERQRR